MLISVVMPVYMVADYIAQSLNSLLGQTEKDFEIILVDDGTEDNSLEVADTILRGKDVKYSVIKQRNSGVSVARNEGLKKAEGEWVICIDPDDCIHPRTFEFIRNIIDREGDKAEVVAFNYALFDMEETFEYMQHQSCPEYRWIGSKRAMELYADRTLRMITPGLCIRKSVCKEKEFYYNTKIIYSEDTLYIWNILLKISGICYIDTPLYYYLMRPGSTMTSSGIKKIMNGYKAYINFCRNLNKQQLFAGQEFVLPRWVFGVIHQAAHYMNIADFRQLIEEFQYREHMKKLVHHRKLSIRFSAMMVLIMHSYSYFVLRTK